MQSAEMLSRDTEVILLLCGRFAAKELDDVKPLTTLEYHRLSDWLQRHNLHPANMLESDFSSAGIEELGLDEERIDGLLERGTSMALALEEWLNIGLQVLSPADQPYPARLYTQLAQQAPPLLFSNGDHNLLNRGGLAVVGSRDVDKASLAFTENVALAAVQAEITIISGAARGVDQAAMLTALEEGGSVVGVVADKLNEKALWGPYRDAIRDGRLALISAVKPDTPFSTGNAMNRNRLIYALADYALVADSGAGKGGTWTGATENLKQDRVPLFVRKAEHIPEGNARLLALGGIPLERNQIESTENLKTLLEDLAQRALANRPLQLEISAPGSEAAFQPIDPAAEIFDAVWPILEHLLREERSLDELRTILGSEIAAGQLRFWLKRACAESKAERLTGPVRYVAANSPNRLQRRLFEISESTDR